MLRVGGQRRARARVVLNLLYNALGKLLPEEFGGLPELERLPIGTLNDMGFGIFCGSKTVSLKIAIVP